MRGFSGKREEKEISSTCSEDFNAPEDRFSYTFFFFFLNSRLILPGDLGEGNALEKEVVMRGKVLGSQTVASIGGLIIST